MYHSQIVIAKRSELVDGRQLIELIKQQGVTRLQAVPALWQLLLKAGWDGKPDLVAMCGGEPLSRDLAASIGDRIAELWNMYGPTETTIWSSIAQIQRDNKPIDRR